MSSNIQFSNKNGYPLTGLETEYFMKNMVEMFQAAAEGKAAYIKYMKTPRGRKMVDLFDAVQEWSDNNA